MRNILIILAALVGFGAFAQTNIPTRIMLADTNGVVKWPSNITRIRIGGTDYTNLLGFGLSVTNGQLSVDTTQLPEGSGGSSLITSVGTDFEVSGGALNVTNTIGTGPLVRQSEAGSGGGGTNFINAVSADFEVLTQSLSLTNTTGTGALLRASSLSPYLLSATAASTYATLESPSFTGTVSFETIQADEVQVPFANLYASANSSSNLTGTLDGGSWTNLNGTEIRSGTVADARIDSAIARVSALSAYQPTNVNLTTVAGLTGGTSTNFLAGDGAFKQVTTNMVPGLNAILATIGSGSGSDTNWNGSPIASGTITNLTVSSINLRQYYNTENGDVWSDGFVSSSGALIFGYPFTGSAISSGTSALNTGTTNNPGVSTINAAAGSNSGYTWYTSTSIFDLSGRGPEFLGIIAFPATNNVVSRIGFQDTITATDSTDGAYLRLENGFLRGVVLNNGSATYTATSNQIATSSTTYYRALVRCSSAGSSATFWLLSATSGGAFTTNWTDTVTATLPTGTSRLTGAGIAAYDTTGSAAKELLRIDAMGIRFNGLLIR